MRSPEWLPRCAVRQRVTVPDSYHIRHLMPKLTKDCLPAKDSARAKTPSPDSAACAQDERVVSGEWGTLEAARPHSPTSPRLSPLSTSPPVVGRRPMTHGSALSDTDNHGLSLITRGYLHGRAKPNRNSRSSPPICHAFFMYGIGQWTLLAASCTTVVGQNHEATFLSLVCPPTTALGSLARCHLPHATFTGSSLSFFPARVVGPLTCPSTSVW